MQRLGRAIFSRRLDPSMIKFTIFVSPGNCLGLIEFILFWDFIQHHYRMDYSMLGSIIFYEIILKFMFRIRVHTLYFQSGYLTRTSKNNRCCWPSKLILAIKISPFIILSFEPVWSGPIVLRFRASHSISSLLSNTPLNVNSTNCT